MEEFHFRVNITMIITFTFIKIIKGALSPQVSPVGSVGASSTGHQSRSDKIRAECPNGNNSFQQNIKEAIRLICIIKSKCCYHVNITKKS